jgi:hypothetical protein
MSGHRPSPLAEWRAGVERRVLAELRRPRAERRPTTGVLEWAAAHASHSDDDAKDTWPSYRAQAEDMGCHRVTAIRRAHRARALRVHEETVRYGENRDGTRRRDRRSNLVHLRHPKGSPAADEQAGINMARASKAARTKLERAGERRAVAEGRALAAVASALAPVAAVGPPLTETEGVEVGAPGPEQAERARRVRKQLRGPAP